MTTIENFNKIIKLASKHHDLAVSISIDGVSFNFKSSNTGVIVSKFVDKGFTEVKTLHKDDVVKLTKVLMDTEFTDEPDADQLFEDLKEDVEEARESFPEPFKKVAPAIDCLDWWVEEKLGKRCLPSETTIYNELTSLMTDYYGLEDRGFHSTNYIAVENYLSFAILTSYKAGQNMIGIHRGPSSQDPISYITEHKDELDYGNHWIGKFIPTSGKAKTLAAEIISNCHYILYRWFNDGDSGLSWRDPNMFPTINVLTCIDYRLDTLDRLDFCISFVNTLTKTLNRNWHRPNAVDSLSSLRTKYLRGDIDEYEVRECLHEFDLSDCVENPIFVISSVLITMYDILETKPEFLRNYDVINLRNSDAHKYIFR